MKPNAAPVRVIDRVGEQVVEVDDESAEHDRECGAPTVTIKPKRNQGGDEEMERRMDEWAHGVMGGSSIPSPSGRRLG